MLTGYSEVVIVRIELKPYLRRWNRWERRGKSVNSYSFSVTVTNLTGRVYYGVTAPLKRNRVSTVEGAWSLKR